MWAVIFQSSSSFSHFCSPSFVFSFQFFLQVHHLGSHYIQFWKRCPSTTRRLMLPILKGPQFCFLIQVIAFRVLWDCNFHHLIHKPNTSGQGLTYVLLKASKNQNGGIFAWNQIRILQSPYKLSNKPEPHWWTTVFLSFPDQRWTVWSSLPNLNILPAKNYTKVHFKSHSIKPID